MGESTGLEPVKQGRLGRIFKGCEWLAADQFTVADPLMADAFPLSGRLNPDYVIVRSFIAIWGGMQVVRLFQTMLYALAFTYCLAISANADTVVAVIGTGDMGDSIGPKLAEKGYRVVYGSRDPARESVRALVQRTGANASASGQLKAAQAGDIVVLAVPWPAMETVAQNLGDLDGKIVVDISTPARQAEDGYLESMVDTSSAELIQQWNPGARVVKTVLAGSYIIDNPLVLGGRTSTFIAADDRQAKEVVARLAYDLGIEPVDAGPLRHAREIEAWARLWFVPAIQKRKQGFEMGTLPSNHWYCIWDDDWYEPVGDSGNLAQFPSFRSESGSCSTE